MRDRMRDRLKKLILENDILCHTCGENTDSYCAEYLADYLIENGVIVPPCKVGQTVFSIVDGINLVFVGEVYEFVVGREHFVFRSTRKGYFTLAFTELDIGKTVFLTREEAERVIKGGAGQ